MLLPNTQKDRLLGKAHMVEGMKNRRWERYGPLVITWVCTLANFSPSLPVVPHPRKALHAALVARVHLSCPQVIIIGARIACVIGMGIGQATVIQRGLCRRAAERKLRL